MFALLYAAAFSGFAPGLAPAFAFGLVTSAMT